MIRLVKYRPGRCPEISEFPEILKVVLKFTLCPEFLTHVLKSVKTPVSCGSSASVGHCLNTIFVHTGCMCRIW